MNATYSGPVTPEHQELLHNEWLVVWRETVAHNKGSFERTHVRNVVADSGNDAWNFIVRAEHIQVQLVSEVGVRKVDDFVNPEI